MDFLLSHDDILDQPIRTVVENGEPWWAGVDLCRALEIKDHKQALASLDDYQKGAHKVRTLGGAQTLVTVNESGLYALIGRSIKPAAKAFNKWVTTEVLPSIRKFGVYPPPATVLIDRQTVDEGREKGRDTRFLEELEAFVARKGTYLGLFSKGQYTALTKIGIGDVIKYLDRDQLWLRAYSAGFDLRYILWGERTMTEGEKAIVLAYRTGDDVLRSHLLARASAGPTVAIGSTPHP